MRKALVPRMEICAGLELTSIDRDRSVAEDDANKPPLFFSAPAPDAGADRNGHRIRLTRHGLVAFRALGPSQATFAISRWLASVKRPPGTLVCRLKTAGVSGLGSAVANLT